MEEPPIAGQDYWLLDEYATRPRKPREAMKFDFSRFHPMDHRLITRRCWTLPGGPKWHLQLWWRYMRPGIQWLDVTEEDHAEIPETPDDERITTTSTFDHP